MVHDNCFKLGNDDCREESHYPGPLRLVRDLPATTSSNIVEIPQHPLRKPLSILQTESNRAMVVHTSQLSPLPCTLPRIHPAP